VRPLAVVKLKPAHQTAAQLASAVKHMQVKIVVFDGPPQPFDNNIVHGPTPAVHAEGDTGRFKGVGKFGAGKLGALISVKDLRWPITLQRFGKGINAKVGIQGIG